MWGNGMTKFENIWELTYNIRFPCMTVAELSDSVYSSMDLRRKFWKGK